MLVRDHINLFGLAGCSPLIGPNDERFGPRFFAVNHLYQELWRLLARQAAQEVGQPQSNELTRGPPELVQHFRLKGEFTSAQERCMS